MYFHKKMIVKYSKERKSKIRWIERLLVKAVVHEFPMAIKIFDGRLSTTMISKSFFKCSSKALLKET